MKPHVCRAFESFESFNAALQPQFLASSYCPCFIIVELFPSMQLTQRKQRAPTRIELVIVQAALRPLRIEVIDASAHMQVRPSEA